MKKVRYTGDIDLDMARGDSYLMLDVFAENFGEFAEPCLKKLRMVYKVNKFFGKKVVKALNSQTGGREFLGMFFQHWIEASKAGSDILKDVNKG